MGHGGVFKCRLSTVRNANNIVVMKAGQITEQGTHAQLMRTRGVYYSLVKRQSGDGSLGTEDDPDKRFQKVTHPSSSLADG